MTSFFASGSYFACAEIAVCIILTIPVHMAAPHAAAIMAFQNLSRSCFCNGLRRSPESGKGKSLSCRISSAILKFIQCDSLLSKHTLDLAMSAEGLCTWPARGPRIISESRVHHTKFQVEGLLASGT